MRQHQDLHTLLQPFAGDLVGYEEPEIPNVIERVQPYLCHPGCEGEMMVSVGKSAWLTEHGADGMVDISPFTCMNGIVSEAIYPKLSKAYGGIPIRNFYFDGSPCDLDDAVGIYLELACSYSKNKKYRRRYPDRFLSREPGEWILRRVLDASFPFRETRHSFHKEECIGKDRWRYCRAASYVVELLFGSRKNRSSYKSPFDCKTAVFIGRRCRLPGARRSAMWLRCCFMFISTLALFSTTCFAGIGFQPILPEELKMTSEPKAPGAPAIILYRQVDRDDSGTRAHEDEYFRIKILTEEGRKYADIEIPFYSNVININARTIRPDGSVANYQGKVFEKVIAKAKGLKYMAKTFTLPDVQVGSIIEYYYTTDLSEHYVYDSHWILSEELFTRLAKFSLKRYTSAYSNVGVRWTWQGLPAGTIPPKEGPDQIIRLEAHDIAAFQAEDFMPPENELKARVDFTYSDDFVESDPDLFWKKQGKKINDAVESFINKRKAMGQAVAQIVSPADPPEVKLQKIYARVQQIRNTSYEPRKTEEERKRAKEKDADNVEDVWKRGYGNGVQITWLFLGLARAAGFDAYGVIVSDRRNYFFNPRTMDAYKLNANVVLVKVNGKEMFFDPGAAFTPFGMLEWSETGVTGRKLDRDGGSWIQTALPASSASRIQRKAELTLSENGDLEGSLTVSYTGLEAMQRRREERNQDETERRKYIEGEAKDFIPAACELDLANKPDWSSSSVPLVAEYHLKIPGWVAGAGHRAMLPVGLFTANEKHVFDHTQRTHPIYFEFPSEKVDDIRITLPFGWQVASLPAGRSVDTKAVRYFLKAEDDKGSVHLTRNLGMDLVFVEAQLYPALRDFFQVVRTGDEEQIVLQPLGTSAAK